METFEKAAVEIAAVLIIVGFVAVAVFYFFTRPRGLRRRIFDFLGVKKQAEFVVLEGARRDKFLEVDLHRALRDFLPSIGLKIEVIGVRGATPTMLAPAGIEMSFLAIVAGFFDGGMAGTESFATGPDDKEAFLNPALHLISGGPYPVVLYPACTPSYTGVPEVFLMVATVRDPAARTWAQDLLEQIDAWAKEHSVFRGHFVSLDTDGNMSLRFAPQNGPDHIVLDEDTRRELDRNFVRFLRESPTFEAAGISSKRGLLLCGEPGTGKTTTCRYLKQELPDHTIILADSTSCFYFRRLFEIARKLEPAIVVIEDVDLLMPSRESMINTGPLRDLLNEMDGAQRNGRLSVVMTSNSWEFLDVALADRPGRIDHVMLFERPGPTLRRALLEKLLKKCAWDLDFEALNKHADGLTPAQLTEMVKKAMVSSLMRRPVDDGGILLEMDDFRVALEQVRAGGLPTKMKRKIGLKQLTT